MISKIERTVAYRYIKPKKKEGFLKVISIFSFLGIMLGVATLIIVMSVMNGFRTELINKIVNINGHILIYPTQQEGIKDFESIESKINNFEFVEKSIPMIEAQILALGESQSSGGLLRGVPLEKLSKMSEYEDLY